MKKKLSCWLLDESTQDTISYTLLVHGIREISTLWSFIEKKFQSKHQGNRYFPPNKPKRPWPLSNCIFGVVDVFFLFFSDISSLECVQISDSGNPFLSAIVLINFWRYFRYTASNVSGMWLLRHNRVRANDLRSIVSKRVIRTHIRWLKSPLRMRTTIKKQYKTSKQQRQRNITQGIRAHITRLIYLTK